MNPGSFMHLYRTATAVLLKHNNRFYYLQEEWDELINQPGLHACLQQRCAPSHVIADAEAAHLVEHELLPPVQSQEVWAAGVTYLRSRDARIEESVKAGGADCYQRVYEAERPELFFKSMPHRVAGHNQSVFIRRDSGWNVPEPELALFINRQGIIAGYSIGNDMSSRSIEGENPLYLPQAKVYERSASLGPCLWVRESAPSPETTIHMTIQRGTITMYDDSTPVSRMKRSFRELAGFLFRECDFPAGCYLMTGTCLVPPPEFTLQPGDRIDIHIDGIGTLTNTVALKNQPE